MKKLLLLCCLWIGYQSVHSQKHPCLLLTREGVAEMCQERRNVPAFDYTLQAVIDAADASMNKPLDVPVPRDGGGGLTHEQHKSNYYAMFDCGVAYQVTGDKKYAHRVGEMLMAYAKMYPTLGFHPIKLSSVPGRLFWQTLNESVWLVHTSVAYDCVREALTENERVFIEHDLLHPMANFIINGMNGNNANNKVFNRMHNHGTWATAAVGMAGMAMDDQNLIDQSLYGSDKTGKKGGFIRQLDYLFSPDGYFTEGAYYQRYAIWPFMVYAQCINHRMPELKIFDYRDGILIKAVKTLLQMNYAGEFLRFNDALLKRYDSQEIIYALDIAYNASPNDKELLSIARDYQRIFLPTDAGFRVARDIQRGEAVDFKTKSMLLSDGRKGDEGGVVLMRSTDKNLNSLVTVKATGHGLSHGHFDKLTMAYYDNGHEILPDYGAARWLNIEAKYKGHYTPENEKYAKQTISHNTLVVDGGSHYGGEIKIASNYHANISYVDLNVADVQIVTAMDTTAYKGVKMTRTTAYVTTGFLQYPLIIDIVRARSQDTHNYDLPYWYKGQPVSMNHPYSRSLENMSVLGHRDGYQYLWLEAQSKNESSTTSCYTFLNGDRFYSLSTATNPSTEMLMIRTGANDPNYHLRNDATAYMLRESCCKDHTFASVLETHGTYDLRVEQSSNLTASCTDVVLLADNDEYTVMQASFIGGHKVTICLSHKKQGKNVRHSVKGSNGQVFKWTGAWNIVNE